MDTLGTCPGPPDFFLFEGPPTGCGEIIFSTNYLITFAKINCKENPVNTFQRGAPFGCGGTRAPMQVKTLLEKNICKAPFVI